MKIAKVFLLTVSFAVVALALAILPQRLCFDCGETYTFYCGTSSADCKEITVKGNAAQTRLSLKNVCGEATIYSDFDLESFLKQVNGKVVFSEEIDGSVNYYCSADLPYSLNLRGATINLHVCVRGDRAKVASPIIFGGY